MDNIVTNLSPLDKRYFEEGGAVLIDKPLKWTSFDVVNKLRFAIKHHLQVRKYKVGHAGTLDPLASGLLLICFGKYTKLIDSLISKQKSYEALVTIGVDTPTYDSESLPSIYYPEVDISPEDLENIKSQFLGKSMQIPPMYSAIKIKGTPLYKLARRGEEVQRKSRPIEIFDLQLDLVDKNIIRLNVTSSKGTYIRTLAYDIGKTLNSGAYLSALRRTRIGNYSVENAITIDTFIQQVNSLPSGQQ